MLGYAEDGAADWKGYTNSFVKSRKWVYCRWSTSPFMYRDKVNNNNNNNDTINYIKKDSTAGHQVENTRLAKL